MNKIQIVFPLLLVGALVLECALGVYRRNYLADKRDVLCNLTILIVNRSLRPLSLIWMYFIFVAVTPLQVFTFPNNHWLMYIATFLVAEFGYYWYHRLSHEVTLIWCMHHTHHSSSWFNLTTAVRLNWVAKFVSPLFFVPIVLLGFDARTLMICLALGLFYQLFLHTEQVPRLGWFEGKLLNTPSAHRAHHGSNRQYIDRNFGGALIIFDRIFKTYQPEQDRVKYGVTTGFSSHIPLKVQFGPFISYPIADVESKIVKSGGPFIHVESSIRYRVARRFQQNLCPKKVVVSVSSEGIEGVTVTGDGNEFVIDKCGSGSSF